MDKNCNFPEISINVPGPKKSIVIIKFFSTFFQFFFST